MGEYTVQSISEPGKDTKWYIVDSFGRPVYKEPFFSKEIAEVFLSNLNKWNTENRSDPWGK